MNSTLQLVPIDQVEAAKDNPRRSAGDVDELAASIRAVGVLEPLIVTNGSGDRYELVAGARRLAGAKKAGLAEVPVIVRELTEEQRQEVMLIENLQRADLSPPEEAEAFQRLLALPGYTQAQARRATRPLAIAHLEAARAARPAGEGAQAGRFRRNHSRGRGRAREAERRAEAAGTGAREQPARLGSRREAGGRGGAPGARAREADPRGDREADARRRARPLDGRGQALPRGTYDLPKGAVRIEKGGAANALTLDPGQHKSEPCHAAVVDPRRGDVVYVCTDRGRHPKLKTQNEGYRRSSGKSEARAKHDREIREANKTRHAFIAELLAQPRPRGRDETLEILIVETLIGEAWKDKLKIACELLAVEPTKNSYGASFVNYAGPLIKLARQPGKALRVGLAIRLAVDEQGIAKAWNYWSSHKEHFAWLEQRGYEISPAEKRELAGKAPR